MRKHSKQGESIKIWCDFAQLHTSIASISGMDEDIDKRKTTLSTTITPTFDGKLVKFGPPAHVDPPKVKFFGGFSTSWRKQCRDWSSAIVCYLPAEISLWLSSLVASLS